ncbi:hypothetical protein LJC64_02825 [Ruminococcaceae bacterium OttesenSCG-928-A11]|nr:hypothetical protein [Ruminococcaceae bacterium OttesenSCG-928-A11]
MENDKTYEKIIAEYKASLAKIDHRIAELKKHPDVDGLKLATLYQMRHGHRQAIKSMSRYIK